LLIYLQSCLVNLCRFFNILVLKVEVSEAFFFQDCLLSIPQLIDINFQHLVHLIHSNQVYQRLWNMDHVELLCHNCQEFHKLILTKQYSGLKHVVDKIFRFWKLLCIYWILYQYFRLLSFLINLKFHDMFRIFDSLFLLMNLNNYPF